MHTQIKILPALEDNYMYLILWDNECAVVDPSDAGPVLDALEKERLTLKYILNTHHHFDHIGGNQTLKNTVHCQIIGPSDPRIPFVDRHVKEGDTVEFGPYQFQIIKTPGHTKSHILYYEPVKNLLFCGDTLFGCGCGMLFEGTPNELFDSLEKIRKLPPNTLIYCGHEYTLENLEFAISIEKNNNELKEYYEQLKNLRQKGLFTVPSTVEIESKFNPFLRAGDPKLKEALDMSQNTDLEVFTFLRKQRDEF